MSSRDEASGVPCQTKQPPVSPTRTGRKWVLPVARIAGVSGIVLVPCFWQSRIQAGDLSSHVYNAWLALLASHGKVSGLELVPQWTNIAFDYALRLLLAALRVDAAQRIAVAAAVLVFFWGAFAFVATVARRPRWPIAPLLAMLAYGWVFHVGFFNFYVSLGLCLSALAFAWKPQWWSLPAVVVILAGAVLAHPLPVAWAVAIGTYAFAAHKLRPRYRLGLALMGAACIILLRRYLLLHFDVVWSADQIRNTTGADQLHVFGLKFAAAVIGWLAIWLLPFIQIVETKGWKRVVLGIPFQLCLLTSAGIFCLPRLIVLPGVPLAFEFIPERMSLALAVLICALVGGAACSRQRVLLISAVTAIYFACLYADTRALNEVEDKVTEAVRMLPPGRCVVSSLCKLDYRLDPLIHMVDRACVGRCFSYGNYEPSSRQFSVRARTGNGIVAADRADAAAIQTGRYIVKPNDLPMYELTWNTGTGRMLARALRAGDVAGRFCNASASEAISARMYTAGALPPTSGGQP